MGAGYRIKKLRYEALPGLWIPALLYEPDNLGDKRVPVVMNVNGHDGKGKVAPYKQIRCINQAKRGMLALNVEWLGMGQLRTPGFMHYRMNQLDLCGTSGLAPFYLSMSRGLDLLAGAPERRCQPGGCRRPLRRWLADDYDQFAGWARHAGRSGGGLFQLSYAGAKPLGSG